MAEFYKTISGLEDANDAVEIIWLHGWGQDNSSFKALTSLLERRARHISYDLPGFGQTPMLDKGAGSAEYAAALATQISPLGHSRRIIIGHSFGCRVAVQLAANHPGIADCYILIAAAGLQQKRSLVWKIRAGYMRALGKLASLFDRLFGTKFRPAYARRFGSADYKNAGDLRETFVNVVNEDLSAQARQVKEPVMLVFGSEDRETPVALGESYRALMPDATLKVLDGYGHLDILGRGAHQVQNIILSVIKTLDSTSDKGQ